MTKFNREKVLERVSAGESSTYGFETTYETRDAWDVVKAWIKDMVKREPVIMARVARKTFGDLGTWIEGGSDNIQDVCGCLVGSAALELVKERNHFVLDDGGTFSLPDDVDIYEAIDVFPKLCKVKPEDVARIKQDADDAGGNAATLGQILGQDTAVALIKSEIRLQLRLRQKRVKAAQKAARTRKRNVA